ncbi:MAG: CBS domain-containing protein [Gemmatimonadota bacterium]
MRAVTPVDGAGSRFPYAAGQMGTQDVTTGATPDAMRSFTRAVLRDLQALRRILDEGLIEEGVVRFGAEQEMFLVDEAWRPAPLSPEILDDLTEGDFTTEIARFNLELNLPPLVVDADVLTRMRGLLEAGVHRADEAARARGARVVLTGILPTLAKTDLSLDNMTPNDRYRELNEAFMAMAGGKVSLRIEGVDEIRLEHDSVMLEAANTSFQIHLQVGAADAARLYNISQAAIAPVLSACVNSPFLFGKRLWGETRIALFQQSLDTRAPTPSLRELSGRVDFGTSWARDDVLEIYREDLARFRVIMAGEPDEDPMKLLDRGEIPRLGALQLFNGTVYRWNRPCYGVADGVPHLRIECRALPAGPSVADEVANCALWLGVMRGLDREYGDPAERMDFADARANFVAAARYGLKAGFTWLDGEAVSARTFLRERLIPLATETLREEGLAAGDVDEYMGIIRDRVETGQTGARWLVTSATALQGEGWRAERLAALVAATAARQESGLPGHLWEPARLEEAGEWKRSYLRVEQYMSTDLYTVHQDALVDLVAFIMDSKHVRQILVEDDEHRLVGVVSYRSLLRLLAGGAGDPAAVPVEDIMEKDPVTIGPRTSTLEAIAVMREKGVSYLPVVQDGKLVGSVSERTFMPLAAQLMQEKLSEL